MQNLCDDIILDEKQGNNLFISEVGCSGIVFEENSVPELFSD